MTDTIPAGYTSLTPFLCVADGDAAIAFYTEAFGATVVSRMDTPDGGVAHAELDFGTGRLQLGDAAEAYKLVAPDAPVGGGEDRATHSIALYLAEVDAVTARAVELGAVLREPPTTFVTGDRFASVLDPFGHRWSIMTRVEEVSPAEQERRLAEWAASRPG
ncbi:VOC family protein [uncultured Friedmanniella sp.]|uniref:VOC family protein n=1 Tax=uncultured Friedmanniella sp. TaxID=335381 RepID=UPI0035CB55A8